MTRDSRLLPSITRIITSLFVVMIFLGYSFPASAQDGGRINISLPETSKFPTISFYLEAYKSDGSFITDLQTTQVQVQEDDKPLPVEKLERIEPGIQFTVAINPSPVMGTQVDQTSVFKKIQAALLTWTKSQPAGNPNQFSLTTNSPETDSAANTDWSTIVQEFDPEFEGSQTNLKSLTDALDLATTPISQPFMKRAILYITALPTPAEMQTLSNLADRAAQQSVRIFVWLVAAPNTAASPLTEPLQKMASQTGGQFFIYTGTEELPAIDSYLLPMRFLYHLSFSSSTTLSGSHRLTAHIFRSDFEAVSQEQLFSLRVEPPNPMFLAPPGTIQRKLVPDTSTKQPVLTPTLWTVRILIEFPDNFIRPLARTRLYVDGVMVDENNNPPFDRFDWPLEGYLISGIHNLKVEAVDKLGLSRVSIETPVMLVVEKPRSLFENLIGLVSKPGQVHWQKVAQGGAILAAVLGIAGVLVFVGRSRKPAPNSSETRPFRQERKLRTAPDPVTQPVPIQQDGTHRPAGRESPSWPRALSIMAAPAWLVRLAEDGSSMPKNFILLNRSEVTLGSDPQLSIQVIDDPSVGGLHARLLNPGEGVFLLADAGSIAGTWVNFAPVGKEGIRLEHGDLVHLGRAAYRFELNNPSHIRQAVITPYHEKE
jgi:hypothetical protein